MVAAVRVEGVEVTELMEMEEEAVESEGGARGMEGEVRIVGAAENWETTNIRKEALLRGKSCPLLITHGC